MYKSTLWWLFCETNEFVRNILYTNNYVPNGFYWVEVINTAQVMHYYSARICIIVGIDTMGNVNILKSNLGSNIRSINSDSIVIVLSCCKLRTEKNVFPMLGLMKGHCPCQGIQKNIKSKGIELPIVCIGVGPICNNVVLSVLSFLNKQLLSLPIDWSFKVKTLSKYLQRFNMTRWLLF